jgi:cell division protein FtsI (penicillin-binding protein 3)
MLLTADDTNSAKLQGQPFRPVSELPKTLPEGSHRVISEYTSAEMRKMMEGIVLHGTGKDAALNGYSAAGKTGTAQKVDPATHTYSKTKLIASFAGFAPVNNPAISVAVIIDSPEGQHMGGQVSAPVFAEVAQGVLEYLGVPHDEPTKPQKTAGDDSKSTSMDDGDSADELDAEQLNAMFAEVNNLPSDDPLRAPPTAKLPAISDEASVVSQKPMTLASLAPGTAPPSALPTAPPTPAKDSAHLHLPPPLLPPVQTPAGTASIVTDARRRVAVPSFVGEPVRRVVETAGGAGLEVQLLGSGVAREQAPAAGTMVPLGTAIVVRFAR